MSKLECMSKIRSSPIQIQSRILCSTRQKTLAPKEEGLQAERLSTWRTENPV